jgi:PAS domain S-box-containing protein
MKKRPTYQELQNKIKELERETLLIKKAGAPSETKSDRAQQYLDIAEVMLIALDRHGQIIFLNRKGHQILGYAQGELMGKPWFDTCLPAGVRLEVRRVFNELMAGVLTTLENYENEVLTKQGQERFMAWHNTILKNEAGQIIGTLSSGMDITERKKIEASLKESEERYRRITEAVTDYIFTVQVENGQPMRTVHGPACMAVTGYTSEEFAADPYLWIRMVQLEDHPLVQEHAARILTGQDPGPIQHRIRRKDGNVRWVNHTPVLHCDASGRLVSYDGLIRDITEHKQAEEALRLAQYSIEQVPMAAARIGPDGRLLYVNQTAKIRHGLLDKNLADLNIAHINSDLSLEKWPEFWRQVKEKKTVIFESHDKFKDGRTIPVEITAHFMEFEGQPFILGFSKDITERKQAEELNQLQRDLAIALSTSDDLKEAMNLVLLAGMQIEEIDCGGVYLVDPITGDLDLIVHSGLSHVFIEQTSHYKTDSPSARLIKRGQPVFTQHSQVMGKVDPVRVGEGLRALAVLPVQAEGRVIAALNLASHKHEEIPLAARSTLETLAAQIGGTILRLQAQEALRVSQYSIEHAPFPMARIDAEARFLYVNEATCRHFGYTKEELLSMGLADINPGFSIEAWFRVWEKLKQKKTIVSETRHKDKKGHIFPVELTNHLMEFEGQQYVFSSAKDITERKQAENLAILQRDLAFSLSSTNDLKEALNLLVQTSTKIEGVDCGGIYLVDPVTGGLDLIMHVGLSGPFVERTLHFDADSPSALLVKKGKPVFSRHSQVAVNMDLERRQEGLRATAILPVQAQGRVIAVLNLASHTHDEILPAARSTLENLAAQVGGAITRLQAQEAMRQSEEKHRRLYETMPQGIVYQDSEGKIISANPAAEKILELKLEEMQGRLSTDQRWRSIHEDGSDFPGEAHPSMISLRTGQPVKGMVMGLYDLRKNRTRWIRIDAVPLFRPGEDKPYQVYTTFDDITDRKKAEEALRRSEEKYRDLVENINEVIYSLDEKGIATYASPMITTMLGYQPSEVIGQPFAKFVFEEDLAEVKEQFNRIYADKWEPQEYRVRAKSGEPRWIRASSRPIYEEGRVVGIQGMVTDITAMKHLEAQLRQAQKMEAIGTLAGGIAHDFNNILGIIVGNTELALLDIPEASPAYHNLEEIRKACLRARDVVLQILSFSRQTEAERRPLKLGFLLRESLKLLRSSIPSSINIQQNILSRNDIVMADATQISQVLLNLCTNAVHAMRETGGILEISLRDLHIDAESRKLYPDLRPGNYIQLSVSDSGHGIDPTIISRIFDPYFTTKKVGEGTGLGLAVVHGIVKNHGGIIWVESQPGQGTTFHVLLPSILTEPDSGAPVMTELPKGNERILFVEDERAVAEAFKLLLEKLGYIVTLKTSSLEALELFRNQAGEFDLVITDQTMPVMTGLSLAKEMLKIRPELPIILCTGYSEQVNEENAKALGIKAFLMKPIMMQEMAKVLRKVLGKGEGVLPFSS